MAAKPALPKAPSHLTATSRKLWDSLVERYDLDPEELATLTLALESLDQAATARRRLKDDGQYVKDRFKQLKAHPANAVFRDASATYRQLMTMLGIPAEEVDEDQPKNLRGQFQSKDGGSRTPRSKRAT